MAVLMSEFVPHFDLPFRIVNDGTGNVAAATVEQDTGDDIRNCVLASLLTYRGFRPEQPDFGTQELAFSNQPIDLTALADAILRNEPRAQLLLSQWPDVVDSLIAHVNVFVQVKSEEGS